MAEEAAVASPEASSSTPPAAVPVSEAAPTAGAEPAAPDTTEGQSPKPEALQPERTFKQSEVDKIVQKRIAKEARRLEREIAARVENEYLRRQVQAPESAQAGKSNANADASGKPVLKDFPDYESWVEAVADWKVEQRIAKASETATKERETAAARQHAAEIQDKLVTRGNSMYEDFEDVALAPDLPVSDAMVLACADSEHGPTALYYLGEHPEEAARISKLSAVNQVREIDKLIATLTKPAAPTKAPDPIKPNGGDGGSPATLLTAGNDYDRWVKLRNRQLGRDV